MKYWKYLQKNKSTVRLVGSFNGWEFVENLYMQFESSLIMIYENWLELKKESTR